jgi:predicted small lipoprotein YifL
MPRIKPKVKSQLLLATMVLIVAACGQRGPLYLPEPKPEPVEKNDTEANDHKNAPEPVTG